LSGDSEKIGVSNAKANEQEREIQLYEHAFIFRIAFVVGAGCMGFAFIILEGLLRLLTGMKTGTARGANTAAPA
jgi:hypothetical protein